MTAAILIVGDDPVLQKTRTDTLKAWQVSTATSQHAIEEFRSRFYDLIIFCQTIPDETSRILIDHAHKLDPTVKTLAMRVSGPEREVDADPGGVLPEQPNRLRNLVTLLLQMSLPTRRPARLQ